MKRMTACRRKIKIHMINKNLTGFLNRQVFVVWSIIVKLNIFCGFYAIPVFI